MPKILNLTGQRFDRLTVIKKIGSIQIVRGSRRAVAWLCVCDCGEKTTAKSSSLRTGGKRSCGCLIKEHAATMSKSRKTPPITCDITGQTFGRLMAVKPTSRRSGSSIVWECRCSCGRYVEAAVSLLKAGGRINCGCGKGDATVTHGDTRRKRWATEYATWKGMLERCRNLNNRAFDRYGGRGISVCERWTDYANFIADMGRKPHRATLDRIDNDKGYSPDNCRWATYSEQARNTRANRRLTINGVSLCVAEWSERSGIPARAIVKRLNRKWGDDAAVFTPLKRKHDPKPLVSPS